MNGKKNMRKIPKQEQNAKKRNTGKIFKQQNSVEVRNTTKGNVKRFFIRIRQVQLHCASSLPLSV